jgi:hypothetical protein
MQLPEVKVTWQAEENQPTAVGANTMITIIHGQTLFNYLNLPREEAERRFQQAMAERNPFMAAKEPTTASALVTKFDDEFLLWLNAGEEMQDLAQDFLAMLGGQFGDEPPKGSR